VVVVGAGVAGLAAATAVRHDAADVEVLVLEQNGRVGGLVETERTADGFVIEHGADALLTSKPWGLAAAHDAGLDGHVVAGGAAPRRTYVSTRDGLVVMPHVFAGVAPFAVWSLLRTPLLSAAGKARVALEPLVPREDTVDESVRSFVTRRFGRELAREVVEPLVGGIYGGDADRLSAEACLPRLRAFERDQGSVARGVHRAIRERRRAGGRAVPPVVTLEGGMASLPEALAHRLDGRVVCGVAVRGITRGAHGGFRIDTARGAIDCDGIVLATPAWRAAALVDALSADLSTSLARIAHTALDCVTLAWRRRDVPSVLEGTGWVRGAGDRRRTLACTWSSEKWWGRAPAGFVLVRSVLSAPQATDRELIDVARRDLHDLIGVEAMPCLTRVRRLLRATPIYEVGHVDRIAVMAAEARALGAFALAGNAYGGIGVPDCVASGARAARAVLDALAA
jgi:oxygen-dependent protoporphyrinogen oxidase